MTEPWTRVRTEDEWHRLLAALANRSDRSACTAFAEISAAVLAGDYVRCPAGVEIALTPATCAIIDALGPALDPDHDPECVCGVARSEHAGLGCPDGFEPRRPTPPRSVAAGYRAHVPHPAGLRDVADASPAELRSLIGRMPRGFRPNR